MKKKKILRHNFNMVEVMLAIVIITLGISSTLVLFPVALNANKGATANNSIADIAEYVMAFVNAQTTLEYNEKDGTGTQKLYTFKTTAWQKKAPTESEHNAFKVDVEDLSGWSKFAGSDFLYSKNGSDGIFLILQKSGIGSNEYVDFSAVAWVYVDNSASGNSGFANEYFFDKDKNPRTYNNISTATDEQTIDKFLMPVVLELSWPATVPYSEREVRYFRFEIYNGLFKPIS